MPDPDNQPAKDHFATANAMLAGEGQLSEAVDTETRLRLLVTERLGCDADQVTADARFDKLGADSLDMVELTMAVEDEWRIEVRDDEAAAVETFGQMVALVEAKLAAAAGEMVDL